MNSQHIIYLNKEQLRQLQLKCVEILSHVIKAIDDMNLTYYCVGGTALGTVKYNGFIPWDDDIDIAMPREDFMKFLLNGNKFLPNHLFISSCFTEKKYFGSVAKIRDMNTAYFDIETARFPICHGIFIDVFPIDGYRPLSKKDSFFKKLYKGKITFFERQSRSFVSKLKGFVCSCFCMFKSLNKCCVSSEKILMKNKLDNCSLVYNRIMTFHKELFGVPSKGLFEGLTVNLPSNVEEYLRICYGDITKEPSIEKQYPHHFALMIDVNESYKNFVFRKGKVYKKC